MDAHKAAVIWERANFERWDNAKLHRVGRLNWAMESLESSLAGLTDEAERPLAEQVRAILEEVRRRFDETLQPAAIAHTAAAEKAPPHVHDFTFEEWSYNDERHVVVCECGARRPSPNAASTERES